MRFGTQIELYTNFKSQILASIDIVICWFYMVILLPRSQPEEYQYLPFSELLVRFEFIIYMKSRKSPLKFLAWFVSFGESFASVSNFRNVCYFFLFDWYTLLLVFNISRKILLPNRIVHLPNKDFFVWTGKCFLENEGFILNI